MRGKHLSLVWYILISYRCLYVIRSLRKEGYSQKDIDHLFKAIVLPKITYGLPVYGASASDLNAVQCFLKRCHKRPFISELINIHDLLEKADRTLFEKIVPSGYMSLMRHGLLVRLKCVEVVS